jgi:nitrous oxidase accessory protein NosD
LQYSDGQFQCKCYWIKSSLSTDNIINCNHFNNSYRGVYFKGPCTGTDFRGNYMSSNFEGLYLDGSAVIGNQSHRGNIWAGNFSSGFGANNVNSGFQGLIASKFEVNTIMGTTLHPVVPLYNIALPAGTAPINWVSESTRLHNWLRPLKWLHCIT